MGSNNNVTTSSTSLPGGVTDAINTAAQGALTNYAAGNPFPGQPAPVAGINGYQQQAANVYGGLTGFTPSTVTAGNVTQYGSPTIGASDISNFSNPYTSQVIGTSLDQINRQLAQTNQTSSGQAAQAGAFGGDRAAIVNTENNRNANQIAAQTIAGLNSQNYTQAVANAQTQASRQLQAGTSQAQLDANVGEANQYAGIQGANLQASAAGQLANLGSTFRGYTQDYDNSIYNQQRADAYYPQTGTSTLVGQLGTLAGASPKTTVTTAPGASTTGQIAGLGTAALGLNSLIPGGIAGQLKGLFGSGSTVNNLSNTSDLGAVAGASDAQFLSDGADFYNTLSDGLARGGIVGYADGGQVANDDTYAPVAPMPAGMLTPTNPQLQFDADPAAAAARADADSRQALFTKATADAQALMQGDDRNPGLPADEAARMSAARFAQENRLPQDTADKLHQAVRGALGLPIAAQQAQPIPAAPAPQLGISVNPSPPSQDDPTQSAPIMPGLGRTAMMTPVDAALATNPADMLTPNGTNPNDPNSPIPIPPIPPTQGTVSPASPQVPDRMTRSADPGAAIPTGGLGGVQHAAAAQDPTSSRTGMALLAAGLGMMASKSHTALGAIGEGGLAGVDQLQKQKEMDIRQQTLQNQAAYQNGMLGVRGAGVGVQQQRVTNAADLGNRRADTNDQRVAQQGDHYQRMDGNAATRNANTAAYQDGRLDQNDDRLAQNDRRLDQGDARLAAQQDMLNNRQSFQAWQKQSKANDQEALGARSILFNATSMGKPMTMDQALAQVRSARSNIGNAPVVNAPGSSQGARPATESELAGARAAIARGVPKQAVMQRFNSSGVMAEGL